MLDTIETNRHSDVAQSDSFSNEMQLLSDKLGVLSEIDENELLNS